MAFRLRDFLGRRRTPTAAAVGPFPVASALETERPSLTPAQVADLKAAWSELRQAVQEAGVISFHGCTRDGSRWQDNPESVRAMTRTIKGTQEYTADRPQDA
ncbi:hypothetical protein [Arthrobacter sp. B1I2]|uniref:hypothetical protein n=1 Tax=Arthrobacter sp. B1I2 TaxID=3042263 RepID=UPI0027864A03|nr:hypothetical protein [Arthrobacter sp. B1I2]MDQ0733250.1 hypothetical protein [Arthrobacter sp. B1I2]